MRAAAKFVKASICPCGFPALGDHVKVGTLYTVHPDRTRTMTMRCGGCGKMLTGTWMLTEPSAHGHGGYLPVEIFEIDEGVQ